MSHTNDKLSRFHRVKLAELSSLAQREKDLKEKRLELLREAEELYRKIAETKTTYGTLYNTGSPLFSLPVEITSSIFQYAIIKDDAVRSQRTFSDSSDDEDITGLEFKLQRTYDSGRNSRLLMEVVVSHVCRYWRSVALNLTTLWTKFQWCTDDGYALGPSIDRLETYLKRSDSRMLDLKLDFRGVTVAWDGSDERLDMLSKILPHTDRWWRVSILSDTATPFLHIQNEVETSSAPNLEHMTVRGNCSTRAQAIKPSLFEAGVPKLSSVTTDYTTITFLPPLSNITSLRIERPHSGMEHLTISQECFFAILLIPNLTNLSLIGAPDSLATLTENLHTIHMPKLKYLRFSEHVNMCTALPYLRAPLLETLIIRGCLPWIPPTEDYFFPSLRTLVMGQIPEDADFLSISKNTSRVTHLTFTNVASLSYLFSGHETYWPDLQVACFNVLDSYQIHDYLTFVTGRINADNPRLTLRISKSLVHSWRIKTPFKLEELRKACFLEAVTDKNMHALLHHPAWPPDDLNVGDLDEEDDCFSSEVYHRSKELMKRTGWIARPRWGWEDTW